MTMTRRLQKATQSLSALERIQLLLGAARNGKEPDPEVARGTEPGQNRAFNRYVALLHVSGATLGPRCEALRIVSHDLEGAAERCRRYVALLHVSGATLGPRCEALRIVSHDLEGAAERCRLLEEAAAQLESEHKLRRPRRVRDWRQTKQIGVNEFLRSLAEEQRAELIEIVALRWTELRAVELAWQELSEEFGGEDPAAPEQRQIANELSSSLQTLARDMGGAEGLEEPNDRALAEVQTAMDDALARLEPLL